METERARESEWEEWVDLGLEIDELRSDGGGEEEEANEKRTDDRGDSTEGDGKEMRAGRGEEW